MKKARGLCPVCHRSKVLTRHHILPRRFFKRRNKKVVLVCRECHDEIELAIPVKPRMPVRFYYEVLYIFGIGGGQCTDKCLPVNSGGCGKV